MRASPPPYPCGVSGGRPAGTVHSAAVHAAAPGPTRAPGPRARGATTAPRLPILFKEVTA